MRRERKSAGEGSGAAFAFLTKRTDGFVALPSFPLALNVNVMLKAATAILRPSVLSRRTKRQLAKDGSVERDKKLGILTASLNKFWQLSVFLSREKYKVHRLQPRSLHCPLIAAQHHPNQPKWASSERGTFVP